MLLPKGHQGARALSQDRKVSSCQPASQLPGGPIIFGFMETNHKSIQHKRFSCPGCCLNRVDGQRGCWSL
ncbi:hypothetical protein H8959_019425 [Pygathrix nigripes]